MCWKGMSPFSASMSNGNSVFIVFVAMDWITRRIIRSGAALTSLNVAVYSSSPMTSYPLQDRMVWTFGPMVFFSSFGN